VTDPRDDDLRALLDDAVSDVDPPPALHHIQARTHTQSSSQKVVPMNNKRPWIFAAVGAVAATAATLVAVTVVTDDDPVTTSGPADSPSASATAKESEEPTAEPSDEATDEPSTAPAGETTSVPVYYVGDTRGSVRLFREFHRLEKETVAAAQVSGALTEALTDSALDPDYRSDWPEGTSLSGVTIDGTSADDVVWIDLADQGLRDRPSGMSKEQAEMAVEQLIHTAQAVLQQRQPVQFLLDGDRTDMVLGVPTSEPLAAGAPMEVQAPVWIISPQEGDTVGRTFTVDGRGAFFEANVSWQLLQDGQVVDEGFATAEEGMTLSPYSFEVTAEPGDYVLRVYDADMSGGEGNGEAEDTKQITVE
jgi:hypothetical protein